jgi:hypothetical protein
MHRDGATLFGRGAGAGFENFDFDFWECHLPIPAKRSPASIPHHRHRGARAIDATSQSDQHQLR